MNILDEFNEFDINFDDFSSILAEPFLQRSDESFDPISVMMDLDDSELSDVICLENDLQGYLPILFGSSQPAQEHIKTETESIDENSDYNIVDISSVNVSHPKRRRGRPRKPASQIIKQKKKRVGMLWRFLEGLLDNPSTNPSLVSWESRTEGTFKLTKAHLVAEMWGKVRRNPDMDYSKMSRAMRYYYKKGILMPVPGKKYVYKFGPGALEKYVNKCQ